MLCPVCLVVLSVAATNQLVNKVVLVAGTRLVNFQTSAAIYLFVSWFAADFNMNYANPQSISLDIYGVDGREGNVKNVQWFKKKRWKLLKQNSCKT